MITDFSTSYISSYIEKSDTFYQTPHLYINDHLCLSQQDLFVVNRIYRFTTNRIILCHSGTCAVDVNLKKIKLRPGEVLEIPAKAILHLVEASKDFVVTTLSSTYFYITKTRKTISDNVIEAIVNLLLEVSKTKEKQLIIPNLCKALSTSLSINKDLLENINSKEYTRKNQIFDSFIKILTDQNIPSRNLGYYANRLCISNHYLSVAVKEVSGDTPMNWINSYIIQLGAIMLSSTLSINEIAEQLGYFNTSNFSKQFKIQMGVSPLTYRKNQK